MGEHAASGVLPITTYLEYVEAYIREAAAFALYWLEEASNSGLHFDQAGVDYLVIFLMSSSSQS